MVSQATMKVTLQELNPGIPFFTDEIKNLPSSTSYLIIGKSAFAPFVQDFVKHKNEIGVSTSFVSLESILQYYVGDAPECIKKALAFAYTNKGTRYVMLIGDASLFPVRHRYVSVANEFGRPKTDYWWYDGDYIATDHYYACLFHTLGGPAKNDYDDWDANKNEKYNEEAWIWDTQKVPTPSNYNPDNVDGYPDLVVGRLPVHNTEELKIYLDKAIKYDNGQMLPQTKNGITFLAAGAYPTSDQLCEEVLSYNSIKDKIGEDNVLKFGFNFPENNRTLQPGWDAGVFASIRNAVIHTWGLVYIGHGNSSGWGIQDNNSNFNASEVNKFIGALSLPVVFSIGCETGQFKPVVPIGKYNDVYNTPTWYWQFSQDVIWKSSPQNMDNPDINNPLKNLPTVIDAPGVYDLQDQSNRTFACPWLFQQNEGGSIAFFGETVVCENYHGRDLIERVLSAYYNNNFVNRILLGDIWLAGQRQFWADFKNDPNVFQNARIYLSIMTFFGDPTLVIPAPGS